MPDWPARAGTKPKGGISERGLETGQRAVDVSAITGNRGE